MLTRIQTIDFKILDWIQENLRCHALDTAMPIITSLGNGGLLWLAVAVVFLGSGRYHAGGIAIISVLITCFFIGNLMLKNTACRTRPCDIYPGFNLLIDRPKDFSFPSGHTMSSFAVALVIYSINPTWGSSAFFVAGLIAFSRLYLYVHFPSDVLAGAVMGIVAAWGAVILLVL